MRAGTRMTRWAMGAALLLGGVGGCATMEREIDALQPPRFTTGGLRGRVVDESTGFHVRFGSVTLADSTGATVAGDQRTLSYVNGDGEYSFPNVKPGVYRLKADIPGYAPRISERVVVNVNESVTVELRVVPKT